MKKKQTEKSLKEALEKISEEGIGADRKHLLEDIGSQFSNYREWIREYVVNAHDAGARWCRIWGTEQEDQITIDILDNGHGMDKQRVMDFMTLFRSVKEGDPRKAVGRFGVGKACILAIPDFISFGMETSTGAETWAMKTGSLLDDTPIHVHHIEPIRDQGTHFSITFKAEASLSQELQYLGDILHEYVRYLPMTITVQKPETTDDRRRSSFRHINDRWSAYGERLGQKYNFSRGDYSFEAIIGLGRNGHEIYQNQVMVTKRYNLFSHGQHHSLNIKNITLRVDSPDFELPFGRHGVRNEEILSPLSHYLRETVLPEYFDHLYENYVNSVNGHSSLNDPMVSIEEIEDLACNLLEYDSSSHRTWSRIPLFVVWGRKRMSFMDLQKLVQEKGKLYLEDSDSAGADYAAFDAPVLSIHQPEGGLAFLKNIFEKVLLNLGIKDMILEQPAAGGKQLNDQERRFETFLGFHPELLDQYRPDEEHAHMPYSSSLANIDIKNIVSELCEINGLSSEARHARTDLEDISWRVNYLVERDGTTPCLSQKFLYKDETVILNLHHLEVRRLLALSEKIPSLSGHWALCMCLEDGKKILRHLTPEAREDLIRLDGMVRCYAPANAITKSTQAVTKTEMGQKFHDYLRTLADYSGLPRRATH